MHSTSTHMMHIHAYIQHPCIHAYMHTCIHTYIAYIHTYISTIRSTHPSAPIHPHPHPCALSHPTCIIDDTFHSDEDTYGHGAAVMCLRADEMLLWCFLCVDRMGEVDTNTANARDGSAATTDARVSTSQLGVSVQHHTRWCGVGPDRAPAQLCDPVNQCHIIALHIIISNTTHMLSGFNSRSSWMLCLV